MMCMADTQYTAEDLFKPGPNYCPSHPNFDMGTRALNPWGFYVFQRRCEHCIVDTIKSICEHCRDGNHRDNYGIDFDPDPKTVQLVLDILDQKLGIF